MGIVSKGLFLISIVNVGMEQAGSFCLEELIGSDYIHRRDRPSHYLTIADNSYMKL